MFLNSDKSVKDLIENFPPKFLGCERGFGWPRSGRTIYVCRYLK